SAEYAEHLHDLSSSSVLAWLGSQRRRRSTTRSATPPAVAQTTVPARWLPSLLAPSHPLLPARDKTSPLARDARVGVLETPLCQCPPKQFVGSPGDNRNL